MLIRSFEPQEEEKKAEVEEENKSDNGEQE